MKKIKLLLASLMCLGLLTGCSIKDFFHKTSEPEVVQPSGDEPSEPEQPETPEADPVLVSIAVSGEFKTEYEVGEEFDSTGIVVTAHFDKGEDKDVTAEASFSGFDSSVAGPCVVTVSFEGKFAEIELTIIAHVYSLEEVVGDINSAFAAYGIALSDKGSYWGVTLNFSEEGVDYSNTQAEEEVLYPVVATLANFMPDYLQYFTADDDFWEDGSGDTAAYAMFGVDEVGVDIIAYCYSGYLLGQIAVYSVAA